MSDSAMLQVLVSLFTALREVAVRMHKTDDARLAGLKFVVVNNIKKNQSLDVPIDLQEIK